MIEWGEAMAGITYFVALPFDVADGVVVVGEPIECLKPCIRDRACARSLESIGSYRCGRVQPHR
jgi:hypothetical protein